MEEYCDNSNSENIETLPRKRQKITATDKKFPFEELSEPEFFNQMGIGILDADQSPSSDFEIFNSKTSHRKLPTTDDDDNNEVDAGRVHSVCEAVDLQQIDNVESPVPDFNFIQDAEIEVYNDEIVAGPSLKNANLTKVIAMSSNSKKRSPLATVTTNTNRNVPQENPPHSKQRMYTLYAEEKYFEYKQTQHVVPERINHFDRLADEIILSVFKWLPKKTLLRCSQVSKQFHRVAQDESLWTRLDLGCRNLRPGAIVSILSRGVVILRLSQAEINDPNFDDLNGRNFDVKLQYLDLSMIVISKPTLRLLLSKCRSLLKLSLEHVELDDDICREIAENRKIEALNLTMCEGITVAGIEIIARELKSLRRLNIAWTSLSSEAVKVFVENVTPRLLQLNIAGCRRCMTNQYVLTLIERCPDLIELDLSDSTCLTAVAVDYICQLKKLEYLSLSRCYNITINSYFTLNNLKSLLYLDTFGLMNEQATQLLQSSLSRVGINKFMHSSVARPTVGTRRTSIWGLRTRD